MLQIILLGPPGAGKGTQAVLLARKKGLVHIATGDIMRAAVAAENELGKQVKACLDKGELVPDELVIDLMHARLSEDDCMQQGFILDGFPRTVGQADALQTVLQKLDISLTHILELIVSEDVLIDRIRKRGESGSGRSDDTVDIATRRLQVYRRDTAPLSDYYRKKGMLVEISGLGTIEEVQEQILSILDKI